MRPKRYLYGKSYPSNKLSKPIKELTIIFRGNESVPEVILNGINFKNSRAGLVSLNLNWHTKDIQSIDELVERKVSLEYYDNPGLDMSLCKLSQSFKL